MDVSDTNVTVLSPTRELPSDLKASASPVGDAAALIPIRGARSQSLTTLPRRASTTNVLLQTASPSALSGSRRSNSAPAAVDEDEESEQQRQRHARRAMSSGSSLSLLQEELGYPGRKLSRTRTSLDVRQRRSSLLETALENTMARNHSLREHSSSNGSGQEVASSNNRQSMTEPEAEEPQQTLHCQGRSWTCNSATCSPHSDVNGFFDSEDDELDELENFMNYREASVTGYSRDTDGVVYYEVIVRSTAHGPLSAYKVRRRYSEFRDLHTALSRVMPVSSKKLAAVTAMASFRYDDSNQEADEGPEHLVGLRFSITECGEDTEPTLPPLPDKGGVWSYLQFDSLPLLERRAKYFHAMLAAAQRHEEARASRLLNDFVGTPPDLVALHSSVENSYVSLNRFAAPKLSFTIEIQERKEKAKSIRRRRSSLKRQSFTGALETTP
ncbi:hypothetical protein BBJ28_00013698 [Nothophytophthora sp. Chile5]|nr:hypothetical protein BBJ28_00013698 [Nothophytophthora sp. Chile5]